ncbi:MAG TPA: hypothetical protein DCZ03_01350 [Gammaproteobacteria bacterium]|nr:hypothetical protein [Gammaproteobacteria bacterium]
MTIISTVTLFFTMLLLALVPSLSVLTVCTRSISHGFFHGALTSLGILMGDLIFIAIALLGLSFLAELLHDSILWVKLFGAAFILWFGFSLLQTRSTKPQTTAHDSNQTLSSFVAGLSITLVDTKAIAFYIGFFPAFIDIDTLRVADTLIILAVTVAAVGGAKLFYAYWSARTGNLINDKMSKNLSSLTGIILLLIGGGIILSIL